MPTGDGLYGDVIYGDSGGTVYSHTMSGGGVCGGSITITFRKRTVSVKGAGIEVENPRKRRILRDDKELTEVILPVILLFLRKRRMYGK